MKIKSLLLISAASILFHASASAQNWPEREISILLGYGPGGNIDLLTRILATRLHARLGVPVLVKNRPGANGSVGVGELARSAPNGYTFGAVNPSTLSVVPQMQEVKYTKDDMDYVAGWVTQRFGMAVRADSPYRTAEDLIKASKDSSLFFGSAAALHALMLYEFASSSGAKIDLVNYKSGAEITNGLLGGQIQGVILNPTDIVPHVASGRLRFIAAGGPSRWPEYPDVPTFMQMGYDVRSALTVGGIAAPKGVPPEILTRMEGEIAAILQEPDFQAAISKLGAETTFLSGGEYRAYIDKNHGFFGRLVRSAGLGK